MFFIAHIVILILFAIAFVHAWRTLSKRRNTPANAWLLPFAYLSLSSWILWGLQYIILIARPFSSYLSDISLNTGLWLGVMQNVVWIIATSSLYSKLFSRVSLTLLLLAMISIVIALVAYKTTVLTLDPFNQFEAASTATIFMLVAGSIVQLRLGKIYAVAFFLHGYLQWIWRYLWFTSTESQILLFAFSFWYIVLLGFWIVLISEKLVTFRVMISSTVKDLAQERAAAERAIRSLNLEGFRAETIGSRPYTPKKLCALWAEQCNAFVLIIGERYGHIIKSTGKSVVEFEFDVAYKQNQEKIFVYVKDGVTREPELEKFLERLRDFDDGYIFTKADDLAEKIKHDLSEWLAEVKQKILTTD